MNNFMTGAYYAPGILLATGTEMWSTAIEYCIYAAIIALSIFALILLRKRSRLPGHDEYRKQLKRLAEGISRLNDGEGKGKFFKRAAYTAYRADALAFTAAAIAEKEKYSDFTAVSELINGVHDDLVPYKYGKKEASEEDGLKSAVQKTEAAIALLDSILERDKKMGKRKK